MPPATLMPLSAVLTISIGFASLALTLVILYNRGIFWLGEQLATFRLSLDNHAKTLTEHAERMANYEERHLSLAADLQRLIGRSEVLRIENERTNADRRNRSR